MSEKKTETLWAHLHRQVGYANSLTTQQMRIVGQRRRDAEEKLEHHLAEARHKGEVRGEVAGPYENRGGG